MKLRRTTKSQGKLLGGVCGGIGNYTGIDVSLWRIACVIMVFLPVPIISIYLICWLLIPKYKNRPII